MIIARATLFAFLLAIFPAQAQERPAQGSAVAEELMISALDAVSAGQHQRAQRLVDEILIRFPTFHLAHALKGDLWLMRARPIAPFQGLPPEEAENFRAEARARLKRVDAEALLDLARSMVLEIAPELRTLLLVDTRNARLLVLENNLGHLSLLKHYYVSIGKLGAEKSREGDQKTSVGVYFVRERLDGNRLTDFYGKLAFPIDYPNELDRSLGRTGHGIWLHGVPAKTLSRPPLASDGCVVLANEDLLELERYVSVGQTPVIITNGPERRYREPSLRGETLRALRTAILDDASEIRRVGQQSAPAVLRDLSIFVYPGESDLVLATFRDERSGKQVRQYWKRSEHGWKPRKQDKV